MTEKRPRTRGKNRRQAFAIGTDAGVTDREDTAVETVQVAGANGTVNRASRKTQRTRQLPNRDDAMLSLRQFRKRIGFNRGVRLPFALHSGEKVRRTFVSPPTQPVFRPSNALRAHK
ncbi:MAG TPA: hypothetical protein VK480_04570, partial [Solirubrobacterales bacterium]|nr:hypothetical protein [Solirubrobacterales bacterium]